MSFNKIYEVPSISQTSHLQKGENVDMVSFLHDGLSHEERNTKKIVTQIMNCSKWKQDSMRV